MKFDVEFTSKIRASQGLPGEISNLASALGALHGDVLISREKHGLHINMACPACLEKEGSRELSSKHLAVNAEKYYGIGQFAIQVGVRTKNSRVAKCMKCGKVYEVDDLLDMPSLEARNITTSKRGRVTFTDGNLWLVPWRGPVGALSGSLPPNILIPGGPGDGQPGDLIPVNRLDASHPAAWYLLNRGYDLDELWAQQRCSFCVREWPADHANHRYYRSLPGGFQDSPQGRIVFFADIRGVPVSHQSRIIDHTVVDAQGIKRYWAFNGQNFQWHNIWYEQQDQRFFLPGFQGDKPKWAPSKYRTANGSRRNELLFGLDAAVAWNAQHRPGRLPVGFLAEGPLDAGRVGRPCMAQIGKFLSDDQADLLAAHFSVVVMIPDLDKAGKEALPENLTTLRKRVRVEVWEPSAAFGPDAPSSNVKDIGDVTAAQAKAGRDYWLNQF